jgi:hypothetical protein
MHSANWWPNFVFHRVFESDTMSIFFLVWDMTTDDGWFVVNDYFFSFFFFISSFRKSVVLSFFLYILILVLILLISYFCSYLFYKSFICFQFSISITIFHRCYFFFILILILLILIFFSLAFLLQSFGF